MSKSDWENWRNSEIQRQALEKENADLKRQISVLESELYQLKLKGHGGAIGVEAIVEKADQERRRYEQIIVQQQEQLKEIKVFNEKWTPNRGVIFDIDDPNRKQLQSKITKFDDRVEVVIDRDQSSIVSYVLAISYGKRAHRKLLRATGTVVYPGTPDDLQTDLSTRLPALLKRAPLPENIVRAGLPIDDETFLDATSWLAHFRYSDDIAEHYQKALREAYDRFIEPKVNLSTLSAHPAEARDEAKNRFRKATEDTFKNMQSFGRGDPQKKPKMHRGSPPKGAKDIDWEIIG